MSASLNDSVKCFCIFAVGKYNAYEKGEKDVVACGGCDVFGRAGGGGAVC